MPTYEYECKECGHGFEAFQAMSDDPLKDCPKCGKEVRRLINGGSGIIFKGSGFYATDTAKAGKAAAATPAKSDKSAEKPVEKSAGDPAASPCANCPKKSESSAPCVS